MSVWRFLSSAAVGLTFAFLVLVVTLYGTGDWLWFILPRSRVGAVCLTLLFAVVPFAIGFWWKSGVAPAAFAATMSHARRYAVIVLPGLCAGAVVILVASYRGVGPRADEVFAIGYRPVARAVPASSGSQAAWDERLVCEMRVEFVPPPWYVTATATLALLSASGWQVTRLVRAGR